MYVCVCVCVCVCALSPVRLFGVFKESGLRCRVALFKVCDLPPGGPMHAAGKTPAGIMQISPGPNRSVAPPGGSYP